MSVTIGFGIGQNCNVIITEEHDGKKQVTMIDPKEFLAVTGLGIYFYQLKPEFQKCFYKVKPRRGQIIAASARMKGKEGS